MNGPINSLREESIADGSFAWGVAVGASCAILLLVLLGLGMPLAVCRAVL